MTREDAIAELTLLRTNVEQFLENLRDGHSAFSQKERSQKMLAYERRIEALTFAIEALEDLNETSNQKQGAVSA